MILVGATAHALANPNLCAKSGRGGPGPAAAEQQRVGDCLALPAALQG